MTKQDVIENVKNHVNGDRQDVLINYYNEQPREFFLNYVKSDLAQDMARDLKRIDAIREHNTDVLDAALRKQIEVVKNSAFADENNLSGEYVSILRRARTYVLDSLYNYYIDCRYECNDMTDMEDFEIQDMTVPVKFVPSIIAYMADYIVKASDLNQLLLSMRCYCYGKNLNGEYVLRRMSIEEYVSRMADFLLQMHIMGNFSFRRKYKIMRVFYGVYKDKIVFSQNRTYTEMSGSVYIRTGKYDPDTKMIEVYVPQDPEIENVDSWTCRRGREITGEMFREALKNDTLGSYFPEYECLER